MKKRNRFEKILVTGLALAAALSLTAAAQEAATEAAGSEAPQAQ